MRTTTATRAEPPTSSARAFRSSLSSSFTASPATLAASAFSRNAVAVSSARAAASSACRNPPISGTSWCQHWHEFHCWTRFACPLLVVIEMYLLAYYDQGLLRMLLWVMPLISKAHTATGGGPFV